MRNQLERLRDRSIIIGAAEIVAAICADKLAVVAGESMTAVGADLAVVVDGRNDGVKRVPIVGAGPARARGYKADRTTL